MLSPRHTASTLSNQSRILPVPSVVLPETCSEQQQHGGSADLSSLSVLEPSALDVICGRGESCYNKPGSKRLRKIVHDFLPEYRQCKTKLDKIEVVHKATAAVQQNGEVRFLKYSQDKEKWSEMSLHFARGKVGHTIREAITIIKKKGKESTLFASLPPSESSPSLSVQTIDDKTEPEKVPSHNIPVLAQQQQQQQEVPMPLFVRPLQTVAFVHQPIYLGLPVLGQLNSPALLLVQPTQQAQLTMLPTGQFYFLT